MQHNRQRRQFCSICRSPLVATADSSFRRSKLNSVSENRVASLRRIHSGFIANNTPSVNPTRPRGERLLESKFHHQVCHRTQGAHVTHQPITVVLPMYNAECNVQRSVLEVLELAHSVAGDFSVIVVDNGSTDETYETACELSSIYPQVQVLRQPVQQGLKRVMELVGDCCQHDAVVVHDGASPINVDQLRLLIQSTNSSKSTLSERAIPSVPGTSSSGSRRFGSLRKLQEDMEQAHGSISGFRWLQLERPIVPRRCADLTPTTIVTAMANMPVTTFGSPVG